MFLFFIFLFLIDVNSQCVIPGSLSISGDVISVSCNTSLCQLKNELENVGVVNSAGIASYLQTSSCPNVWINEINFNIQSDSTTSNQGWEVAGPSGVDINGFTLTYFNPNTNNTITNFTVTINESTIITNQANGFGFIWIPSQNPISIGQRVIAVALQDNTGNIIDIYAFGVAVVVTSLPGSPTAPQLGPRIPPVSTNTSCQRQGTGAVSGDFSGILCGIVQTHPFSITNTDVTIPGAVNFGQSMTVLPQELLSSDLNTYSGNGQSFFLSYNVPFGKIIFFEGNNNINDEVCIYGSNGTQINGNPSAYISGLDGSAFFIYTNNPSPNWSTFASLISTSPSGLITNADVANNAGIVYSKLSLTNSIQVSDISSAAATPSEVANTLVKRDGTGSANFETLGIAILAFNAVFNGPTIECGPFSSGGETIYIPDPSAGTSHFVLDQGASTIFGAKTFSSILTANAGITTTFLNNTIAIYYSQLNLTNSIQVSDISSSAATSSEVANTLVKRDGTGSANFETLGIAILAFNAVFNGPTIECVPFSSGGETIYVPDPGVSTSHFVLDQGASIIVGQKTFSSVIIANGGIITPFLNVTGLIPYSDLNLTGSIVNSDISPTAGIVDSKLAQIVSTNKVASSSNVDLAAATSSEVASTLVKRDGTGSANFETVGLGILSFNAVVNGPTVQCAGFSSGGENILIPDPGVSTSHFVLDQGASVIVGAKTFSSILTANGGLSVTFINNTVAIYYYQLNLSNSIVNADISSSAGITDSKLAQIVSTNKVASSSNVDLAAATSSEVASTLVKRDGTGSANFETVGLGILSFNAIVNGPTVQCAGFASGGENILIPDPGVSTSHFVLDQGASIIVGQKTFSSAIIANGGIIGTFLNITGLIPYSQLNLTASIVNSDISSSAGIVYSKLSLTNSIQVSDIASAAATSSATANTLVKRDGTGSANFGTVGLGILSFNAVVNGPTIECSSFASGGENIFIPDPQVGTSHFVLDQGASTIIGAKTFSAIVTANAGLSVTFINNTVAIYYSQLNLSGSIVNSDISSSAAIVYSKLSLTNSIQVSDISSSAATSSDTINTLVKRDGTGSANFGTVGLSILNFNGVFNGPSVQCGPFASSGETISLPDPGTSTANFVLDQGSSTIVGAKTFSALITGNGAITTTNLNVTGSPGVIVTNNITVTSGGILLPTSGGTPGLFNYFETFTDTTTNGWTGKKKQILKNN